MTEKARAAKARIEAGASVSRSRSVQRGRRWLGAAVALGLGLLGARSEPLARTDGVAAPPAANVPSNVDLDATVQEVIVPVSVFDADNRFPGDLKPEQLRAFDGDVPVAVRDVWVAPVPLRVAVLLDASSSMHERIHAARRVLGSVVQELEREDQASLSAFLAEPRLLVPFGRSNAQALDAAGSMRVSHLGFTGIFDSVAGTFQTQLSSTDPQQAWALLVLTDGLDTVSRVPSEQIVSRSLQAGIPVCVVAVRSPNDESESELPSDERLAHRQLARFAERTRGRALFTSSGRDLDGEIRQMIRDLRSRYMLSLALPAGKEQIGRLRIESTRGDLQIWAPATAGGAS